jgi:hypothetical protein
MLVINDLEWTKTCLEFGPLWAASSSYEGSSFGPLKVTLSCSAYEDLIDDMGNGVEALFAGVSTSAECGAFMAVWPQRLLVSMSHSKRA